MWDDFSGGAYDGHFAGRGAFHRKLPDDHGCVGWTRKLGEAASESRGGLSQQPGGRAFDCTAAYAQRQSELFRGTAGGLYD